MFPSCHWNNADRIRITLFYKTTNTSMNFSKIKIIGGNFVDAKPIGIHKGINFCKTGDLRKIDISSIKRTLDLDAIVLISPLGFQLLGKYFFK